MEPDAPYRVDLLARYARPAHSAHADNGHSIAKHIQRTSEELLQVETGSLYPALHRLELKGWIGALLGRSDKGKRARFFD